MAPTRIAVGFALLLGHVPLAAARCGDGATDLAAVAAARDAIAAGCDCGGALSARDYTTCADGVIEQRVTGGLLPPVCARTVHACVRRSTCGRPGTVTCCRAGPKPRCKITTSERCTALGRCTGAYTSCCDACDTGGCVTTTTTTNPSFCGNGILDPGEACDGGPFCSPTCGVMLGSMCCERSDASSVCSGLFVATGFSAAAACTGFYGGTRFQWGGVPPAGGAPCPGTIAYPFVTAGPCGPPATFPPTTFCCNPGVVGSCRQTVASDVAELSVWLANACDYNGVYPAVVGRCVQSPPALLTCTPGM